MAAREITLKLASLLEVIPIKVAPKKTATQWSTKDCSNLSKGETRKKTEAKMKVGNADASTFDSLIRLSK